MSSFNPSIHIGTSGFQYDHWKGRFYPDNLSKQEWLSHYAASFATVEINNTFYSLPSEETVEKWKNTVPEDFLFTMKFSRYGSHSKCLKDPDQILPNFLDCTKLLGPALGPVLVQLKPNWHANPERLNAFLDAVPNDIRWAIEFRDPSWLNQEIYQIMEQHGAALVIHDLIENHPEKITTDWTYRRFHGDHYSGHYSAQYLSSLADRMMDYRSKGIEQFAYFNNDAEACAVDDALKLKKYLEKRKNQN
jgi:uncharacterized protein YecE (DUF72 family)